MNIEFLLKDVANWTLIPEIPSVSIPALQRGLVWRPKQIELLWDSLMRGIPIGSFVICKNIESQRRVQEDQAEFHLLDGQQRANAIALGFDDVWAPKNIKNSILWLDIKPENMPNGSSRNYLFRVTTTAHPWGYNKNDNDDGRLGHATIRNFLESQGIYVSMQDYRRPMPCDLQPIEATAPIPVSLLLKVIEETGSITKKNLMDYLAKLPDNFQNRPWIKKAKEICLEENFELESIERGLKKVLESKIIALQVPEDLFLQSRQEENSVNREDITSIEHLFQRLNQQGTRLDGEELVYSMLKAYWPEIAAKIDSLASNRMACSRLVNLAFRIILSEEKGNFEGKLTVSRIRRLASSTNEQDLNLQKKIINFINSDSGLEHCCKEVDKILGLKNEKWGLPPVLYSEIAYNYADLYLVLLLWAKKFNFSEQDDLCRSITGIITYSAWFGKDQSRIARILYEQIKKLTKENLIKILKSEEMQDLFYKLHTPESLCKFIRLPTAQEDIQNWTWWNLIADSDENEQLRKVSQWWGGICKINANKSLLLYAQRCFIRERFPEYDPSRKDLWSEHNRPWDYDHILPYYYTYNVKTNNRYMKFCKQWCNTIGNYRAWPFEDNRSDQAVSAGNKIQTENLLAASFISKEEMEGFNQTNDILAEPEKALSFANSCKSRIVRIYKEWFDSLCLEDFATDDNEIIS